MRQIVCTVAFCLLTSACCTPATNRIAGIDNATSLLTDTANNNSLKELLLHYITLKNALVASRYMMTATAAHSLCYRAAALSIVLPPKDTVTCCLLLHNISAYSKAIEATNDETCERQRILFRTISENVYALIIHLNIQHITLYHDYCPMAFNEKGATWLSEASKIKNPYFGSKMLECGEITDTIK